MFQRLTAVLVIAMALFGTTLIAASDTSPGGTTLASASK